jgi:hypothetical protein
MLRGVRLAQSPTPESDSDFRREPENSDYHELENLIFNQRAFPNLPRGRVGPTRTLLDFFAPAAL